MPTGSSSWDGLGMGLFGEYQLTGIAAANDIFTITGATSQAGDYLVIEDADGNELLFMDSGGNVRIAATSSTGYRGMDVRHTGSITTQGFNAAGNFVETLSAVSMSASQNYGLRVELNSTCLVTLGGAREACLHLYWLCNSSASGASRSLIHVDDGGTNPQNFLTLGNCTLDDSFFVTSTHGAGTKALRMMHGSDTYYIMVTSCTS